MGQQALPSLNTFQGLILEEAKKELRFPDNIKTFNKMSLDANIASALSLFEGLIGKIEWKIEAPINASQEEKDRAELLNTNLHSLRRPWEEYINEFCSILKYGFVPIEKIYKKQSINGTTFKGWDHFQPIGHSSIKHWFFDDKSGALAGLKQDVAGLVERNPRSGMTNEKEIGRHKFLLFRHNPKNDNPEGTSPLKGCYVTWKYLSVIDEFEAIAVAKDVGGVIVFEIDQDFMRVAYEDPTSWQAEKIEDLKRYAASMTAGDQTYIMMPMAYNDQGKPVFNFRIEDAQGSGKKIDTQSIAIRHSNKLLMSFFADVLKLGTESHGSFSLADAKTSLLAMAIEGVLKNIQRTLNHDLIRQTYKINEWEYNPFKSARFVYGDIEEEDLDVLSKFIQRVMSVGALRPTTDLEDKLREKIDLDKFEEVSPEVLETRNTSRASDGMETPGEGTSNEVDGEDNSVSNKENS